MITDRYLQVAFDVIRHDPSEEVAKAHLKAFLEDARQQGFVDALVPRSPGQAVHHIDGNPKNNDRANLAIVDR